MKRQREELMRKENIRKYKRGRLTPFLILGIIGIVLFHNVAYLQAEEYEYDALNRVTKVSYEDGSYVEYEYDSNGNILNVNVYNAKPTPTSTPTPDDGQASGESESKSDEETGETTPEESESGEAGSGEDSSESGEESSEQTGESESGTGDSGQGEPEKSKVREFVEQAIEVVKSIFNAISQWFKSWFS